MTYHVNGIDAELTRLDAEHLRLELTQGNQSAVFDVTLQDDIVLDRSYVRGDSRLGAHIPAVVQHGLGARKGREPFSLPRNESQTIDRFYREQA